MPVVFRKDGFNFVIYVDDHEPGHTHVKKAGKEVVINLGDERTAPQIRNKNGMPNADIRKAIKLVFAHQDDLIAKWKELHSND